MIQFSWGFQGMKCFGFIGFICPAFFLWLAVGAQPAGAQIQANGRPHPITQPPSIPQSGREAAALLGDDLINPYRPPAAAGAAPVAANPAPTGATAQPPPPASSANGVETNFFAARENATSSGTDAWIEAQRNNEIRALRQQSAERIDEAYQRWTRGNQQAQQAVQNAATPQAQQDARLQQNSILPQYRNGDVIGSYPQMAQRLREEYQRAREEESVAATNTVGNWQTALQLGQQANQLTNTIRRMDSNLDGGGAAAPQGAVANVQNAASAGAGLMGGGNTGDIKTSGGGPVTDNEALGAGAKGKNSDGDLASSKPGRANFMTDLSIKDADIQKLLEATGTDSKKVPDSFLKNLESQLAKVKEEKEALALVQEMGKANGVSELANLKSLSELDGLTKDKKDSAPAANSGASSMAANDYSGGGARKSGGSDEDDSHNDMLQAVQGMLSSTMAQFQKDDKPAEDLLAGGARNPSGKAGERPRAAAAARTLASQGIGTAHAELFSRVALTLKRYHVRGLIR